MHRREFCELMVSGAGLGSFLNAGIALRLPSGNPFDQHSQEASAPWPAEANYPNNRAPLLETKYVKLPLGAVRPAGWLRDQLNLQASGLTGRLNDLWPIVEESGWKGNAGKNVTPECCTPRFVPRWLEGLTALAGVLDDDRLKAVADPYMQYILAVKYPAAVTPSVCAWSHVGRCLPEYYDLTGDARAIRLARTILDYADSVRDSRDGRVVVPSRLGMLLSFGWWYFNHTGDHDVPALLWRCTQPCVEDWKNYFAHFPEDPKYFAHFPDRTAQKSPSEPIPNWTRQGVDVTQAIQYPALYYLLSKDETDKASVIQGLSNLDRAYGQVGGRWAADEWLASTDPVQGTELCDVEELLYSLEKSFEALGEVAFADRIEQLIYNAFPGTCTADMWAHQYDQQANQVLVSVADRPWHLNGDTSNIYGFGPNFPCCLSNMHSPWPRFVESMWMATADQGILAALYGPSRVRAKVGKGATVEIEEQTDYPFSDHIRFTIHSKRSVLFPIYFRIPAWAGDAALSVSGEPHRMQPQGGSVFKVKRNWKEGDVITLHFNFKLRVENRRNNAAAIAWGPLYFVLRIGESFGKISGLGDGKTVLTAPPGCADWRITPTTDWNYALAIDRNNPQCTRITNKVSTIPFAQKGEPVRAPGAQDYSPWQDDVPIVLNVKARRVPQWGMNGANAGAVPTSPVQTNSSETVVELIPYGCSRLRISEFPTL
jgi:uncharacterized protein